MKFSDNEGFTLIEVLVAFVILASAIIIGLQIHEDGLRRLALGENKNRILAVAKYELAKLNSASLTNLNERAGVTEGVSWRIVVTLPKTVPNGQLGYAIAKIFANIGTDIGEREPVLETVVLTQAPLQ
jgi:prepilin-type N-terminal cleavage/methylation domain-containing protein